MSGLLSLTWRAPVSFLAFFNDALLSVLLYSLLLQHFPQAWVNPGIGNPTSQVKTTAEPPRIFCQFTSAGHILGFGASQVVVGHPTHALTMTLVHAKPVEPVADDKQDQSEVVRHPGERPGPERSLQPKTLDTGFRRYDSPKTKSIHGDMARPFTGSVRYDNPWPGVSVIYRAQAGAILKSEYRLAPGFLAKTIGQIRIRYNRPIKLDRQGKIIIPYALGNMQESAPVAWQEISGQQVPVQVRYLLRGKQEAGFAVKGYDPKYALIIDPELVWNTFLGRRESSSDFGYGLAVNAAGDVYVTGSSDGPWEESFARLPYTGNLDAYVAKLDVFGNLQWNTFLGGPGEDVGRSLALDAGGNVYVAGCSGETWGSPVRAFAGNKDTFVAKLDASGHLLWNTFLGGSGNDEGFAVSPDAGGNINIAGFSTGSWGSPVRAFTGGDDTFAAKLDASGSLLWNTFLGGAGNDLGRAIGADDSLNVFITGESNGTWGSPIRSFQGGADAFAVKLDASGSLLWNTFLGGSGSDVGRGIAVDGSGKACITGYSSADWGSPVQTYTGSDDAFVAELDSSGALLWNTFLGGNGLDEGRGIALDADGKVYIAGDSSGSWGSPVRAFAYVDAFAAKLDMNGHLLWNTFLGGNSTETGRSIAVSVGGILWVGGDGQGTWGNPLRDYSGGYDAFAAKLDSSGNFQAHTFLGGRGSDYAQSIAVDDGGNIYIGGYSSGTWGVPNRAFSNDQDAFAAKLDSGGHLLWNTFLGGDGADYARSIAVDGSGNLYLAGSCAATWGSPLRAFADIQDAFAAKLDTNGLLLWHTFLGGSASDSGDSIAVDGSGNLYVAGSSIATWGSPLRAFSGSDAFAAKLNTNGGLLWNTFLGGSNADSGQGIAVDTNGNIFIVGQSFATWGSPVRAYTSATDVFVAKLDSSGFLLWNTFLGGIGTDQPCSIAVDGDDYVYAGGYSWAAWGSPVRPYEIYDAFAAKLDTSGNLLWNTFLGGSSVDSGQSLTVDANGHVWVCGYSAETWGNPWRAFTDSTDAFVAKVDAGGDLLWNAFLGGSGWEQGNALAVRGTQIYVSGYGNFTWGNPIQPYGASEDAMIVKISDAEPTPSSTGTPTPTVTPTPMLFTSTPAPLGPDFVRLHSRLINLARGESLRMTLNLNQAAQVKISIHALVGYRSVMLVDSWEPVGTHIISRDLSGLGAGTYLLCAEAGNLRARYKIVVIR